MDAEEIARLRRGQFVAFFVAFLSMLAVVIYLSYTQLTRPEMEDKAKGFVEFITFNDHIVYLTHNEGRIIAALILIFVAAFITFFAAGMARSAYGDDEGNRESED